MKGQTHISIKANLRDFRPAIVFLALILPLSRAWPNHSVREMHCAMLTGANIGNALWLSYVLWFRNAARNPPNGLPISCRKRTTAMVKMRAILCAQRSAGVAGWTGLWLSCTRRIAARHVHTGVDGPDQCYQ